MVDDAVQHASVQLPRKRRRVSAAVSHLEGMLQSPAPRPNEHP